MGQIAFRRIGGWDCIKMYTGPIGPDRVFIQSQHRGYKIQDGTDSDSEGFAIRLINFFFWPNKFLF